MHKAVALRVTLCSEKVTNTNKRELSETSSNTSNSVLFFH
jgi:hypothetical protein